MPYDNDTPGLKKSAKHKHAVNGSAPALAADRLPPHSPELEQQVLGSILLDGSDNNKDGILEQCTLRLRNQGDEFYDLRHQTIYKMFLDMHEDGIAPDLISCVDRLRIFGKLEQVGGTAYLSALMDGVTSTANIDHYLDGVLNNYRLRRVIQLCTETVGNAFEANGHNPAFLDQFESNVFALRSQLEPVAAFSNILEVQDRLMVRYENAMSGGGFPGLPTGFSSLDAIIGGLEPRELVLLTGEPSAGKTALALNIMKYGMLHGVKSGIISMETTDERVIHRLNCIVGKAEGGSVLRGTANEETMQKLQAGVVQVRSLHNMIMVYDKGGLTPPELEAIARRMVRNGAQFIVIDYLQLIVMEGKDQYTKATNTSKFLSKLVSRLGVPVIAISSMNRIQKSVDKKGNEKKVTPTMSNLRDSGQLEYDGSKILILYNEPDEFTSKEEMENAEQRTVNCRVEKSKDGGKGTVKLTFFAREFRFEQKSHQTDQEAADAMAHNEPEPPPMSTQEEFGIPGAESAPPPED